MCLDSNCWSLLQYKVKISWYLENVPQPTQKKPADRQMLVTNTHYLDRLKLDRAMN